MVQTGELGIPCLQFLLSAGELEIVRSSAASEHPFALVEDGVPHSGTIRHIVGHRYQDVAAYPVVGRGESLIVAPGAVEDATDVHDGARYGDTIRVGDGPSRLLGHTKSAEIVI